MNISITLADIQELAESGKIKSLSRLVGAIGPTKAMKIIETFGHSTVYIPAFAELLTEKRNRVIRSQFYNEGFSVRQLAKQYRMTVSRIRRIVQRMFVMQDKFDELNALLKTFTAQKADYAAKIKRIQDNTAYTDTGKRQLRQPIDAEYIPLVDATEKEVEQLLQDIQAGISEKANNTDFLSSTEFSNALKLIELSGGKLPFDVIDKINNQFSGNVNALKTLKAVYQTQKSPDGEIDMLLANNGRKEQNIRDSAYYTITGGKPLQPLVSDISAYAAQNGYQFDTSFITPAERQQQL